MPACGAGEDGEIMVLSVGPVYNWSRYYGGLLSFPLAPDPNMGSMAW